MAGYNKAIIAGYVGKDPVSGATSKGTSTSRFSIATTDDYADKDGKKQTHWHNVLIIGKAADVANKYVEKGSQVLVEGQIKYRQWEDNEGSKKSMTEITCFTITLLTKSENDAADDEDFTPPKSSRPAKSQKPQRKRVVEEPPEDDDLPF